MSTPVGAPRRRIIIGLNIMSFTWALGLGASVPLFPLLSYQLVPILAVAGMATGVTGIGSLIASYVAGPLIDRLGRRGVTIVGIVIRTIFSFMEGTSTNILQLASFRFMSGIGTAIYGTGSQVIIADISTRSDRGAIFGGRQSFSHMGNIIGPLLGGLVWGWATPSMGVTNAIRIPFFINGFTKFICLITFILMVGETKQYAVEPATEATTKPEAAPARQEQPPQQPQRSSLLPSGLVLKAIFATGFFFCIYEMFATTLFRNGITQVIIPVYSRHVLELSQAEVGLIISAISVGNLLISFPAGRIVDRWGVRYGIFPGIVVSVAALIMFAIAGRASIPLALLMGMGTSLADVGARSYAMDIAPRGTRGQFYGIQGMAQHFAQLIGPMAVGGLTDTLGFSFPFMLLAGIYSVMIPMALLTVKDVKNPAEAPATTESS